MRRLKLLARVFGVLLALGVVSWFLIRNYGVRAVLLSEIRKQYGGRVELGDWWLNSTSAGITGLALGESAQADSPTWLTADRISTDISIGGLLRGRFLPTQIKVDHPKLALRFDAKGQLATAIPMKTSRGSGSLAGSAGAIPAVEVNRAEITVAQDGRSPLKIARADAKLNTRAGREVVEATTDDPIWGHVRIAGQFDPSFKAGSVTIHSSPGFVVDPVQVKTIPFIPTDVWDNLAASGPIDAEVKLTLGAKDGVPVHLLTKLKLKGAWLKLNPLQVESTDTTGDVTIDDTKVTVNQLRGKAINGTLRAAGTLNFAANPPELDVDLRLRGIDVTKTPAAWQLNELGATGTMTGKVGLRARLAADGIDLTGTTGRAVIEDGSLQGIPIKSLSITMKAQGNDLQFETAPSNHPVDKTALETAPTIPNSPSLPPVVLNRSKSGSPGSARTPTKETPIERLIEPAISFLPIIRVFFGDEGFLGWTAFAISEVVESHTSKATTPPGARLRLPKSITTRIELEDVDLKTILAKVERFGIKPGFPIAGRFSVKATATIPLDSLRNLRGYAIHGDASLSRASIDHVDLGELAAHLDVEDGVVNLSDFRGVLVDRPADNGGSPPPASPVPPRTGPLPDGGFRATVRAEIEPKGMATAKIEGKRLPLGELFAPLLPVPTPLSGDLSIQAEASVNLASLLDPRGYRLNGNFESRRIAYKGARLDRVASRFHVQDGRATVDELSALLAGRPLALHGGLNLAPPYAFTGSGHVDGWQIANLVDFVPGLANKLTIAGRFDANAEASGTLFPFSLQTVGGARLAAIKLGTVRSPYVVFEWRTERGVVILSGLEAAIFGGKITGDARVPTKPGAGQRLDVNLALKGVDTRDLTSVLPSRSVAITGVADGGLRLSMPLDASTVDADLNLIAPDLSFRPEGRYGEGIKVETLRVTAKAHDKLVSYQASADSLGAKLVFQGTMPLEADPLKGVAEAEARASGFRLGDAWRGLGMHGGLAELDGTGSFDANIRATVEPPQLWSRGWFDFTGLRYGTHLPIGDIRGQVAASPTAWKLERVEGTLFGGVATGEASGVLRSGSLGASTFEFKVDRASVPRLLASVPSLARTASGFGSLRATGRLDEALHLTAEIGIPQAQILNMTLTDVRLPAEIDISPSSGVGTMQARRWTGRLAGGSIEGKASARLGMDRSFQSDIRLSGVDLEVLSRIGAISSKASSGKLSGTVSLNGPNPEEISKARGRFAFDLDDATLVALPVFKELDRFLGASRGGGLFEDGDIAGNIGNETIYIEELTLNGRVIQLHAIGSVTFAGGLNLEVLVNTNQLIPQSGLTLLNIIPGLSEAIGQSEKVVLKLASFLSSRLLKFRVTGTVKNPTVALDPGVDVGNSAVGFFSSVLKVPGSRN